MKGFVISDIHGDHIGNGNPSRDKLLRYLEPKLCPADVLFIAGDISDSGAVFPKVIDALSELYPKVVYCLGNHDYAVHPHGAETTWQKIDRSINGVKSLNSVFLNGGVHSLTSDTKVGGTMGAYDFSYSEKHFGISFERMLVEWNDWYDGHYWKLDGKSYVDVMDDEFDKLDELVFKETCNILMTHIGPYAYGIPPKFHNAATGFFYFDGRKYIDAMPTGSIWLYGHTHDQKILDLGNCQLLCNPCGYPGEFRSVIPKSEFVFDII